MVPDVRFWYFYWTDSPPTRIGCSLKSPKSEETLDRFPPSPSSPFPAIVPAAIRLLSSPPSFHRPLLLLPIKLDHFWGKSFFFFRPCFPWSGSVISFWMLEICFIFFKFFFASLGVDRVRSVLVIVCLLITRCKGGWICVCRGDLTRDFYLVVIGWKKYFSLIFLF